MALWISLSLIRSPSLSCTSGFLIDILATLPCMTICRNLSYILLGRCIVLLSGNSISRISFFLHNNSSASSESCLNSFFYSFSSLFLCRRYIHTSTGILYNSDSNYFLDCSLAIHSFSKICILLQSYSLNSLWSVASLRSKLMSFISNITS
jgi:hypothetical protein